MERMEEHIVRTSRDGGREGWRDSTRSVHLNILLHLKYLDLLEAD